MRESERWIVVDTETTGLRSPVYPVEIGAQRMRGWEPDGEPFRVLINFDVPIEPAAERIHGYSREYLREHGLPPVEAFSAFLSYTGQAPVVCYNLSYDWARVLFPTFERIGLPSHIYPGFCALNLTRRVVPNLPNYKLKTVVQAFGLAPEIKHHAAEDAQLVVGLLSQHLGPHLQRCGISGFERVAACADGDLPVPPIASPLSVPKTSGKAPRLDHDTVFRIGELVGICRMITLDNQFTAEELTFLARWLEECPYAGQEPIRGIFDTIQTIVADGRVTIEEQALLAKEIEKILAWRPPKSE